MLGFPRCRNRCPGKAGDGTDIHIIFIWFSIMWDEVSQHALTLTEQHHCCFLNFSALIENVTQPHYIIAPGHLSPNHRTLMGKKERKKNWRLEKVEFDFIVNLLMRISICCWQNYIALFSKSVIWHFLQKLAFHCWHKGFWRSICKHASYNVTPQNHY